MSVCVDIIVVPGPTGDRYRGVFNDATGAWLPESWAKFWAEHDHSHLQESIYIEGEFT